MQAALVFCPFEAWRGPWLCTVDNYGGKITVDMMIILYYVDYEWNTFHCQSSVQNVNGLGRTDVIK